MKRTLLLIFAFLAFVIGSFIWMVASFDSSSVPPAGRIGDSGQIIT